MVFGDKVDPHIFSYSKMFSSPMNIYTSNYYTKAVKLLPFNYNSCSLIYLFATWLASVQVGQ